ncbi:MAG: patatin-like phospholipase family protein [Actinomycetota bacterium]
MSEHPSTPDHGPLSHWPEPLAFVLSGGGAYGAVQVGMLRALSEAGIKPDLIVGSSVGALNGIRYAASPGDAIDALTTVWLEMNRAGVFGGRTRVGQFWSAGRRFVRRNTPSLCDPTKLRQLIDENTPIPSLEDLPIPAAIVVTDALLGRPKTITQGQIAPLLQATSALPGIFPPVKMDGCFYIDGGVTANVPIRQAIGLGARGVVVLDANPPSMPGTVPDSVIGSALHASMIMLRNQRADADDELKGRLPILHLPQPTPPEQSSFDFSQSQSLIEGGFASTKAFLAQLPDLADTTRGLSERSSTAPPPPAPETEPGDVSTQAKVEVSAPGAHTPTVEL